MAELRVMREDLPPPASPPKRHLISIRDLSRDDVERLLATARSFERSLEREMKKLPTLRGRTVVNLFYESSTRTSSTRGTESTSIRHRRCSTCTRSASTSAGSKDCTSPSSATSSTRASRAP